MSTLDILSIPGPGAHRITLRYSSLPRDAVFSPGSWENKALTKKDDDWWLLDLSTLNLPDGCYEYEFVVERENMPPQVVSDPYAEELTRFGGYRGVFRIKDGHRLRPEFTWNDELPPGVRLPNNNEMVIYELPLRWVDTSPDAKARQVGLGTFDKALFERLAYMQELGINTIELLPIQDSPDTLNWGYGTRFFFAPDLDMGNPFDLKLFIKSCHQRGIRVIMDVVMNHASKSPLCLLAYDWFFGEETGRNAWGGDLFIYNEPLRDNYYPSRSFHYGMAEFWIREYHIDGFRIDEFKGIDNWDFISEFTERSWEIHRQAFPDRPFIVIAEDSDRRPEAAQDINKGGKVVDAIWDFDFRDDLRRLVGDRIHTEYGKPSRSDRVRALITGNKVFGNGDWRIMWNHHRQAHEPARFSDMSQRITYCTSHDVEKDNEQRLYSFFLQQLREEFGQEWTTFSISEMHPIALEQMFSAFALMLTTAGVPMFLAGEEFADLHDTKRWDWRHKMSDPIDWERSLQSGHRELLTRLRQLTQLRTCNAALQRNEVVFFGLSTDNPGFHPTFDENEGERVFAYCRTGGKDLGAPGQVIVVANCSNRSYPSFQIENCWYGFRNQLIEHGGIKQPMPSITGNSLNLELRRFQVRVFSV